MDSLAYELHRYRSRESLSVAQSSVPSIPQISSDFIGEHLFQSEPKEMRRITAVRPGDNVTSTSGGAARSAVTCCAAVREARADGKVLSMLPAPSPKFGPPLCSRELRE
jgi:hypothetical protein